MKRSMLVLWALVGVFVVIAVAVSCADTQVSCDLANCASDCMAVGHTGGHCSSGACMCTDFDADADADPPDLPRDETSPDIVDEATPPPPDGADADARDESGGEDRAERRDDIIIRDDYTPPPPEDYSPPPPDGGSDYKAGCDPLVCFMSCGGTCSVGGTCVCEPR